MSAPQADRIQIVSEVYRQAETLMQYYAKRADRLDGTNIALSVLTSGAFWALASDVAPKRLGWAGAVISTIVTFLTIYMYASGMQAKRKKAAFIFKEVGKFLGEVRGEPYMEDRDFWAKFKVYDALVRALRYEKED